MDRDFPNTPTRRHFLASNAFGLGSLALAWLLNEDRLLASPPKPELELRHFDLTPKPPHTAPRARAMISLFMAGGPSHIDLFDPKPLLDRYDGKPFPNVKEVKFDNAGGATSTVMASPWKFRKYGQSSIDVSELLPHF